MDRTLFYILLITLPCFMQACCDSLFLSVLGYMATSVCKLSCLGAVVVIFGIQENSGDIYSTLFKYQVFGLPISMCFHMKGVCSLGLSRHIAYWWQLTRKLVNNIGIVIRKVKNKI